MEIGEKFGAGEVFLPELMMAGDAMKAGTEFLVSAIPEGVETPTLGTIVLGTVKGDIHNIGRNIVGSMLIAAGFNVVDIGCDVPNSAFAEAAEKHRADIIGASAIMATTIPMQKDLIDYLEALKIRHKYKIMVGGGSCTKKYAEKIGADGYGENAIEAVKIAKQLVSKK